MVPDFKYIAGDPALDLVNTVDWTSRGPEQERLLDFEGLTRWAEGAGVLSPGSAGELRRLAGSKPRAAESAYRRAIEARAVLQRLFASIAGGRPDNAALDDFNRLLRPVLERARVQPATRGKGKGYQLDWSEPHASLESVLWPVLWSAAALLTSEDLARLQVCGGPDCGWMYVDRSRNGFRRWCQMETCGTREKSRRRRTGRPLTASR